MLHVLQCKVPSDHTATIEISTEDVLEDVRYAAAPDIHPRQP